jgi:hypothetical protein
MDNKRTEISNVSTYTHMTYFCITDECFDVATDSPNLGATFFILPNHIDTMRVYFADSPRISEKGCFTSSLILTPS